MDALIGLILSHMKYLYLLAAALVGFKVLLVIFFNKLSTEKILVSFFTFYNSDQLQLAHGSRFVFRKLNNWVNTLLYIVLGVIVIIKAATLHAG